MSKVRVWTYQMTNEHMARLSKPIIELLREIAAIAIEVNPPNLEVCRGVVYEIGLMAINAISGSIVQASSVAAERLAKKLGLEPSP